MEKSFSTLVPLLIFTWAIIVSAGVVCACAAAIFTESGDWPDLPAALWCAAALAGAGLLVSFLHLGRVSRAYKAVFGFAHSWLSREAVLASLFTVASIVSASALLLGHEWTAAFLAVAAILGLLAALAVGLVYRLRGQEGWHGTENALGPAVTALYLASAILLGCVGSAWSHWIFWPLLAIDLILAILRRGRFTRLKTAPPLFPGLLASTFRLHLARLLLGSVLAAVFVFVASWIVPYLVAIAALIDRFCLYAGTAQVSPKAEVARVKRERMERAAKEATEQLRVDSEVG